MTEAAAQPPAEPQEDELVRARLGKLAALRAAGIEPYPYNFERTHGLEELVEGDFARLAAEEARVRIAGRAFAVRGHGQVTFVDLGVVLEGPRQQLMLTPRDLDATSRTVLENVDLGDWVGAMGRCAFTRTGHPTVVVERLEMLSKATHPLPNFKGRTIADPELLARMPELAMIFGEKRELLRQRARILLTLRELLAARGYLEVETPFLNPCFGGAEARPFVTHVNALGTDVFLAVSPEIELKRLVVGGLAEGAFAIARNFRNEGIDASHNPEFTSMEVYVPFVDYEFMMSLTEEIFARCCVALHGEPRSRFGDVVLDFSPPWRRVPVVPAVEEATGILVSRLDAAGLRAACVERGLDRPLDCGAAAPEELMARLSLGRFVPPAGRAWAEFAPDELRAAARSRRLHVRRDLDRAWDFLVLDLFETYVEPTLVQPCHVMLHPARSTVLCKTARGGPLPNGERLVERFESFAVGMELSNAYSELNDPVLQRSLVEEQARARDAGQAEAMPHNESFVRSIELGMPPCGGLGIGVDRLVMLLTGARSIREVIAFPLVRP